MSHGHARTTVHGRSLIVSRHRSGMPKSHIAKAMGISRKCVAHWLTRYEHEGEAGLHDRSSRPYTNPTRKRPEVEHQVLMLRASQHRDQDWIRPELGVAPRTVGRILRRHHLPYLRNLHPLIGEMIRPSKGQRHHGPSPPGGRAL